MSVTDPVRARVAVPQTMPWPALLALAAAVFLSITLELLPSGLLPEMAEGFGVSESAIGLTVSVFAFTVVLTSTPLVALTAHVPRRRLLVIVLAVLAASTVATAFAPTYVVLLAVRFAGGLAHGVFWAIVAAEATRLVPERLIGRAIAIVLGGGTLAIVLGVPLATILGQAAGWRVAFGVVGVLTVVGALVVRFVLPSRPLAGTGAMPSVARFRRGDAGLGAVLVVCGVTALTMLGQYAVFTYVAPLLTDVVGVGAAAVGPLLFVYGAAGAVGLAVAGSPLARHTTAATIVAMAVAAAALAVVAIAPSPGWSIAAFAVWGFAFGAIPPLLQVRLLHASPASHRDAASALYTTGFNVGIGGGALVGAIVFDGLGVQALPWIYVVLLIVSIAVLAVAHSTRTASATGPVRPSTT